MTEDKTNNDATVNDDVKTEVKEEVVAEQAAVTESTEKATEAKETPKAEEAKDTTTENKDATTVDAKPVDATTEATTTDAKPNFRRDPRARTGQGGRPGGQRGRGGPRRGGPRREKPEFDQKIVSLRRVTRVMAGGRRFSFSAAIVIGDRKGKVGFGLGKANDTTLAIEKAVRAAKKNMLQLKRTETNSIPFDSQAKFKSSEVLLRPIVGKGLAAGGAARVVLELAGVDEVGGKFLSRSKNNINNSRATLRALLPFATNRDSVNI